jgi:PAS domain S-box-containing protein
VIAARDIAIHLREKALNEHTIVSIAHPDGRIAAVNQNFVETLGYEPDDIVGETVRTFFWSNGEGDGEDVMRPGEYRRHVEGHGKAPHQG